MATGLENPWVVPEEFDLGALAFKPESSIIDELVQKGTERLDHTINSWKDPNISTGAALRNTVGDAFGYAGENVGFILSPAAAAASALTPDFISKPLKEHVVDPVVSEFEKQLSEKSPAAQDTLGSFVDFFTGWNPAGQTTPRLAGMMSEAPNYIPEKYGADPSLKRGFISSKVQEMVSSLAEKGIKATSQQAARLVEGVGRMTSFADWALKATGNAIHFNYNPIKQALYDETGIGGQLQRQAKSIGEDVAAGKPRALGKLAAQAEYNSYMHQQSLFGNPSNISPAADRLGTRGTLAYSETAKPGVYGAMVAPFDEAGVKPAILQGIEDNGRKAWEMKDDAIVSVKGSSELTGDFKKDLLSKRNGVFQTIQEAFTDYGGKVFDTDEEMLAFFRQPKYADKSRPSSDLKGSIKEVIKTKGKPEELRQKYFKPIDPMRLSPAQREAGGVWLVDSFPGTSITEGGVNAVYHVDRYGRVTMAISDKHDYFEKLGTDKVLRQRITFTLPMTKNARGKLQTGEKLASSAKNAGMGKGNTSKGFEEETYKLAEDIAGAKPSLAGIGGQTQTTLASRLNRYTWDKEGTKPEQRLGEGNPLYNPYTRKLREPENYTSVLQRTGLMQ